MNYYVYESLYLWDLYTCVERILKELKVIAKVIAFD